MLHHLSCAQRFGVEAPLCFVTHPACLPPDRFPDPPSFDDDEAWRFRAITIQGKLASSRQTHEHGVAPTPVWEDLEIVALDSRPRRVARRETAPRFFTFQAPQDAAGRLLLRCSRCTARLHVERSRLLAQVRAQPNSKPSATPHSVHAYLADQGEVVYRLDSYAEELVTRDKRRRRSKGAG